MAQDNATELGQNFHRMFNLLLLKGLAVKRSILSYRITCLFTHQLLYPAQKKVLFFLFLYTVSTLKKGQFLQLNPLARQ